MPVIAKNVGWSLNGQNHHLYSCIQFTNKSTQETEIANIARENFESYVARLGLVVEENEMADVVAEIELTGLVVAVVPGVVDNELVVELVPNVVTGASVVVAAPTHPPIM